MQVSGDPEANVRFVPLLQGLTELIESCYTHSYSLFEGKDADENQLVDEAHRAESNEVPNMELPPSSLRGVRTHPFLSVAM